MSCCECVQVCVAGGESVKLCAVNMDMNGAGSLGVLRGRAKICRSPPGLAVSPGDRWS